MREWFVFYGLFIFSITTALPGHAQTFTVAASSGGAYVGNGAHPSAPAVVGSQHQLPSWGRTDDEASLTISFNGENDFRLLPGSEAQVTGDNSSSDWHRVVHLNIGNAEFHHKEGTTPAVHLDCETPTAICGAVGTAFKVSATQGTYSVSQGRISVRSDEGNSLDYSNVRDGSVTLNPGRDNTYSQSSFTGSVTINGSRFLASAASFTVAKEKGSSSATAVSIRSGSLGGNGPGRYLMDGGKLVRVAPAQLSLQEQYLAAAAREGAVGTELAARRAAGRDTGDLKSELATYADAATKLREELFNRQTVREVIKKTTQAAVDAATRAARPGGR